MCQVQGDNGKEKRKWDIMVWKGRWMFTKHQDFITFNTAVFHYSSELWISAEKEKSWDPVAEESGQGRYL